MILYGFVLSLVALPNQFHMKCVLCSTVPIEGEILISEYTKAIEFRNAFANSCACWHWVTALHRNSVKVDGDLLTFG